MDGIIFDVDGTIWDIAEIAAEAWNTAIKTQSDLDVVVTAEYVSSLFGKTMEEITNTLFPGMDEEEKRRISEFCFDYENELLKTKSGVIYDGIIETVIELAKDYPLYIVSNCQEGYIEATLKKTGLEEYFIDHLCFGETLKPKSYTISKLMERNNLKDVVYIGDTDGDAEACREIDIPFIFVTYGFGEVDDAKWVANKPLELIEIIKDMKN